MENSRTKLNNSSFELVTILLLCVFIFSLTLVIVAFRQIQLGFQVVFYKILLGLAVLGTIFSLTLIASVAKDIFQSNSVEKMKEEKSINRSEDNLQQITEDSRAVYDKLLKRLEYENEVLKEALAKEKDARENETINLRSQLAQSNQNIAEWQEQIIEMFKMLERTLANGNQLDEGYRQAMVRTKNHLSRLVESLGIHLIEPQKGTPFDDKIHQIVGEINDSSLDAWRVVKCEEWGYMINGSVFSTAKVIISRRQ